MIVFQQDFKKNGNSKAGKDQRHEHETGVFCLHR